MDRGFDEIQIALCKHILALAKDGCNGELSNMARIMSKVANYDIDTIIAIKDMFGNLEADCRMGAEGELNLTNYQAGINYLEKR
jgi:hypothetical protein